MPNDRKSTQGSDVDSPSNTDLKPDYRSSQLSRMRKFSSELDRLMRKQFYSSTTPEEFLNEATKTTSRVLGVKRVSVWSYTKNQQAIECNCLFDGEYQKDSSDMVLHRKDFPSYFDAISQSRVVTAHDAQTDSRTSEFTESYLKPLNIKSMLDAHVPSASGVRGVLCCESVETPREWAADEAAFAASVAEFVGLTFDRAERVHTQKQLADALRAAEKAGEAKSAFLANMSHEIRTPMNGILGMLELVLSEEYDELKRESLQIAHNSARSLLSVLDDVLDYSRLEAGEFSINVEQYDPSIVIEEVTNLFRVQAEAKKLSISHTADASIPSSVVGDQARVRQVISNFVSNALKFTDKGRIHVHLTSDTRETGERIRFEVTDTGIGLSRDSLPKLFQRFSQVDNSSTRKYGGTGLGLVICKQLTELMGGTIGVESEEEKGSTFWISLPVVVNQTPNAPNNASNGAPEDDDTADTTSRLRVLAAEDNLVNQKVLQAMINSLGHDITMVGNGQEALDMLSAQDFDLVLMDVQMPVMDGVSATKAIRSLSSPQRNILIIALTANAMEGDRERYLAAGMNDYLAKPYERDQLVKALAQAKTPLIVEG